MEARKSRLKIDPLSGGPAFWNAYTQAASCGPVVDALADGPIGAALINLLVERHREIEAQSVIFKVPTLHIVASLLATVV